MFWGERHYKARKTHKCGYPCGKEIDIGEKYIQVSMPPWQDYEMDVDEEGRTIGFLLPEEERHWQTVSFHSDCYYEYIGY